MEDQTNSGDELTQDELERYARHISLTEIGIAGQKQLKKSSVLCVGSGGLGSPLLLYLAAAGVGTIGIVDCDFVEESNLQRQIIHSTHWLGKEKTNSASARIAEINPFCKVNTFKVLLSSENALEIMAKFDIICDCTDNFPSRYLINDACVILGKPNVFGSVDRFAGQATVFNLDSTSPNYRDLVPIPPPPELIGSCAESGVMGVVPGLIGVIQATEVIKIITKIGTPLNGKILIFDALKMRFRELNLVPSKERYVIKELIDYEGFCAPKLNLEDQAENNKFKEISVHELKGLLSDTNSKIILLDVRQPYEYKQYSIEGSYLIPLQEIENGKAIEQIKDLSSGMDLYIHCKSGARSKKALYALEKYNIKGINILGGIDAWIKEFKS